MPDYDVHTEHDPREPVVGHARVEDDAMSEPATGETPVEGSATTYESAAHNGHDAENERAVDETRAGEDGFEARAAEDADETRSGEDGFETRTGEDTDEARATEDGFESRAGEDADEARATQDADEARAGEDGFADRSADDEAFRDRTTHEDAFEDEARGDRPTDDRATADAGDLTYTGEVADLPDHPDTDRADLYHAETDSAQVDRPDAGDDTAVVDDAAGGSAGGSMAPPVHPETGTAEDQPTADDQTPTPDATPDLTPTPGTPDRRLWADADVDGLRGRWRELQLKFIDDPQGVAGEAESLVAEAVDALTAALNARKDELSDWREAGTGGDDTERLRAAVRRYRDLFDQLLGL